MEANRGAVYGIRTRRSVTLQAFSDLIRQRIASWFVTTGAMLRPYRYDENTVILEHVDRVAGGCRSGLARPSLLLTKDKKQRHYSTGLCLTSSCVALGVNPFPASERLSDRLTGAHACTQAGTFHSPQQAQVARYRHLPRQAGQIFSRRTHVGRFG